MENKTDFRNNKQAIAYAKKFTDSELLGFMAQAEAGKWFGELVHHPGNVGRAKFLFKDGICFQCVEPIRGKNNTFNKSEKF